MRLHRRDILLLLVIWGGVAVLVGGAILVLRGAQTPPPAAVPPPATRTPALSYAPVVAEQTARKMVALAETAARGWRADAQLVSCRGSWEQTAVNLVGRPIEWSYRFYSPQSRRLYFVVVAPDGRLDAIQHVRQIDRPPPALSLESWQMDSPATLANWLNAGGGEFLGSHPGSTVTAQLSVRSAGAEPEWTVAGYERNTDGTFVAVVNALDGETTTPGQ